ncbi:MAG: stage 0 sporulation protein [Desulfobacterota bacterium]|nr:stage 0 sporulation protein [Thermodesulfobacteriota bacterium]MDW8001830.1 regulatory iron-sulfur-containing complex subunit RicT [Deltaproteobacteria bacterium]
MKTCYVKLKGFPSIVEVEANDEVKKGDIVVLELEKGLSIGEIITDVRESEKGSEESVPKIVKKASPEEISDFCVLEGRLGYAMEFCRKKIEEFKLPMKLLCAEYLFGGTKLIFYFYSETRVDFRELVKELAREFRVRIELRQVGVRDQAKIIGGLGNCGDVVCCKKFLNSFFTVSIKMVKEQNLALNPSKISGVCGRLMCCLAYEYEMYMEYKRELPKIGKMVTIGTDVGRIVKQNPLLRTLTVQMEDGRELTLPAEKVKLVDDQERQEEK